MAARAPSRLGAYLRRSRERFNDQAWKMITMQGAKDPYTGPLPLFKFNTRHDMYQYAKGCDADIGGTSTVHLDLDEDPARNAPIGKKATGKFWGEMRLGVKPEFEGKVRGGYAGFRNIHRTSLFGEITNDLSMHQFLALRLRVGGHPRTRNSYFVNIQTDVYASRADVWQHRLYLNRTDGGWEEVYIPFDAFVRTQTGLISIPQSAMHPERVRTIGISILGGNSGMEGRYELGIDEIWATNEEPLPSSSSSESLASPTATSEGSSYTISAEERELMEKKARELEERGPL